MALAVPIEVFRPTFAVPTCCHLALFPTVLTLTISILFKFLSTFDQNSYLLAEYSLCTFTRWFACFLKACLPDSGQYLGSSVRHIYENFVVVIVKINWDDCDVKMIEIKLFLHVRKKTQRNSYLTVVLSTAHSQHVQYSKDAETYCTHFTSGYPGPGSQSPSVIVVLGRIGVVFRM